MRITRMPCSSSAETQPKNDVHPIDDATFVSRKKISFLVQIINHLFGTNALEQNLYSFWYL